jgi:acyl-CoA synthetase (AMP-forming)/AMP-acid ligase II/acyl carrier protein
VSRNATAVALLGQHAAEHPDDAAHIVAHGRPLTFARWDGESAQVAAGLVARGVAAGEHVGLVFEQAEWCEFAVAYAAVLKAGAIAVPLSRDLIEAERADLLARLDVRTVLTGSDLPGLASVDAGAHAEVARRSAAATPGDEAEVTFTSGTTGTPKAVAATHGTITYHLRTRRRARSRYPIAQCAPIGTIGAHTMLVEPLGPAARAVVTLPAPEAQAVWAAVVAHDVGELFLPPPVAGALARSSPPDDETARRIKRVSLVAAATPAPVIDRLRLVLPESRIFNVYSSTEAWPACTILEIDETAPRHSVGRPWDQSAIRIAAPDRTEAVAGEVGEVLLRPPQGAAGKVYLGRAGTEPVHDDEGWIRAGDVGYVDADGFLFLLDRVDDVANPGGWKVYCGEVEAALLEHPLVLEAAVFSQQDPDAGEVLCAAVTAGAGFDLEELESFLSGRLSPHKVPRRLLALDELPHTTVGKIDKRLLREVASPPAAAEALVLDEDETREAIAGIWREVLGLDEVDPDDNFFALGGTSLLATRVLSRIQATLGFELPASAIFMWSTVRELTRVLVEHVEDAAEVV